MLSGSLAFSPCTRALQAIFDVMGHEYRTRSAVPPAALDFIAETLLLSGRDGAQHRAIIAPRLAFLRHVAPGWVDDHCNLLFEADAPDDLGQMTVDFALSWGRPNSWLLEHLAEKVRDAVRRGVNNSLDHLLVAMLWQIPGYGLDEMTKFRAHVVLSRTEISAYQADSTNSHDHPRTYRLGAPRRRQSGTPTTHARHAGDPQSVAAGPRRRMGPKERYRCSHPCNQKGD
jgi:hypothetical protein